jgi:DNA-binding MarR family transcriptional regulator
LEREISLSLARETSCCGVTAAQCHFLLENEARPNASLTDLADALSLDASTMSRTADGLLAEGFIVREADPENRRKVSIRLTDAGRGKVESINSLCDESYLGVLQFIDEAKRHSVIEAVGLLAEALARKRKSNAFCCTPPARSASKEQE